MIIVLNKMQQFQGIWKKNTIFSHPPPLTCTCHLKCTLNHNQKILSAWALWVAWSQRTQCKVDNWKLPEEEEIGFTEVELLPREEQQTEATTKTVGSHQITVTRQQNTKQKKTTQEYMSRKKKHLLIKKNLNQQTTKWTPPCSPIHRLLD